MAPRTAPSGALARIVVPHIDSAAEAREVVNCLKYPPVGHRSMGGFGPHYGLRSASSGEAAAALNAANLTIVMLETPTADRQCRRDRRRAGCRCAADRNQ